MTRWLVLVLALAGCASAPQGRPSLKLTAHPRMAFGPLTAHLMLEIVGGQDVESYYCPRLEWNFGDGTRATRESDCEPWTPATSIERRYSIDHCYRTAGDLPVTVSLWRASRKLAETVSTITILPRAGGGRC